MQVQLERVSLPFARPIQTAYGTLEERELLVLTLTDSDGIVSHGEAAPLEPYDGVPLEIAQAALQRYVPVLERGEDMTPPAVYEACREIAELPHALAAVDMALWDRAGLRAGKPISELITDDPERAVEVNATIVATDQAGAADEAAAAVRAGYRCVKLKVGIGDDAGRVAAVRAAIGPAVALRLDANGAWDVEEAVHMIEMLAPAGLELVEEPVHGVAEILAVRERVPVRIAIDETASAPGALGCSDAVALKLARCGGIGTLLASAALIRARGAEPYLASTYDGPLGIAAALHCAAALGSLPPCGLATGSLFAEPFLEPREGFIEVPSGPGLGVS